MPTAPSCPRCGEPTPPGEPDCPYCAGRKRISLLHREPVIIAGIVMVTVGLWVLTTFVTRAYAARQQHLARQWFESAVADMHAGRLDRSLRELQTALSYSHDNSEYRLRLAEALAAQGHTRQAQAYLRALWDEEPGNGIVNLESARLAAKMNDVSSALRFYHGAIYGVWQDDPVRRRLEARLELVEILLANRQNQQAQSELIGVAADLPRDPALMLRVGQLLMKAGDSRSALSQFRELIALEPRNVDALAGAGKAAFSMHQYPEARDYLRAAAERSPDPQVLQMLQTAELVLQMDPYQPRLAASERDRRIVAAFVQAGERLQQCASSRQTADSPLAAANAAWNALKPSINERKLRRNPEQGDAAMDLVFRIERDATKVCGPGSAADQVLIMIAQRREGGTT